MPRLPTIALVLVACAGPPQLQLLPDAPLPDEPGTLTGSATTVVVHDERGDPVRTGKVAFIAPGETELRGVVALDAQGWARLEAPSGSTIVASMVRGGPLRTVVHAAVDVPAGSSIRFGPATVTPAPPPPTEIGFVFVEAPPFARSVEWFVYARGTATELVLPPAPGVSIGPSGVRVKSVWLMRSAELAQHPFDALLPGSPYSFSDPRPRDLAVSSLAP